MAVVDLTHQAGKTAHTTLRCLGSQELGCLVHCTLHTGRTHQIRVHMAHVGHPLIGDAIYGGPMTLGIERQALHAFRLSLRHPITQAPLVFEAPINAQFAPDLQALLERLNLSAALNQVDQQG